MNACMELVGFSTSSKGSVLPIRGSVPPIRDSVPQKGVQYIQ